MHEIVTVINESLALAAASAPAESAPTEPEELSPLIRWILHIGVATTAGSILLCLVRMLRGPELPDRVLAADVLALQVVALVILLTIVLDSTVFYDVALVVAIIGFASTVALANYIAAQPPAAKSPPEAAGGGSRGTPPTEEAAP